MASLDTFASELIFTNGERCAGAPAAIFPESRFYRSLLDLCCQLEIDRGPVAPRSIRALGRPVILWRSISAARPCISFKNGPNAPYYCVMFLWWDMPLMKDVEWIELTNIIGIECMNKSPSLLTSMTYSMVYPRC